MITGPGLLSVPTFFYMLAASAFIRPSRVEPITFAEPNVARHLDNVPPVGVEIAEIYRASQRVKLSEGLQHRSFFIIFPSQRRNGSSILPRIRKQLPNRIRQNRVRADLDEDLMTLLAKILGRRRELDRFA